MGQSPFAPRIPSKEGANRRRSTRIDAVVPVIITGRDANGQTFREQTETVTINLHGAKLYTRHDILVGMQVGIESPRTGLSEKAICVGVFDRSPGEPRRKIAVQLIRARELWGLEDPPPDWRVWEQADLPVEPVAAAKSPAQPTVDAQYAELEEKVSRLVESVLNNLQAGAQEIVSNALQNFEGRLENLVAAAETRVGQRSDEGFAEFDAALQTFRADIGDELSTLTDETVASAEKSLRAKIGALLSTILQPAAIAPSSGADDPKTDP